MKPTAPTIVNGSRRARLAAAIATAALLWATTVQAAGPYLYVAHNGIGADSAAVIDLDGNVVVATVPAGNRANLVAVSADGSRAYVNNSFADGITVIDTVTHAVIDTVSQQAVSFAMVLNPILPELYGTRSASDEIQVTATDDSSFTVISLNGPRPASLAVNANGTRLYTANVSADSVSAIDTTTRTVLATFPVSDGPLDLRLNPDGSRLYVLGSSGIDVIDTGTNTVLTTIAGAATGFALDPSGRELWRLDAFNLCVFDLTMHPPVPGPCGAAAVTSPSGMIFNPAGTHLYVANRIKDEVLVFDITQPPGFPFSTILVGDEPMIGPQAVVTTVGRDAVLGSGTWIGHILTSTEGGVLGLDLTFHDAPLQVFGATLNLSSILTPTRLSATLGPGSPPMSRALDFAHVTAPIQLDFENGTLRCDNACSDNRALLSGRLIDLQGSFPPGVSFTLEGDLQAAGPLHESGIVEVSGTFTVSAVAHSNTPAGSAVVVHGGTDEVPVTVTYTQVTGGGTTTIRVANTADGVLPADFDLDPLGGEPIFVTISTDASVTPPITVCVGYPDNAWTDLQEDIPPGEPGAIQLWHSTAGGYRQELTNRTIDTEANIICAQVDSLSPFAVTSSRAPRSGFVPPDTASAKCEIGLAKAGAKLAKGVGKCHTRAAADALAGKQPQEEACEAQARAAFSAKVGTLQGCPPCAVTGMTTIPDRVEQLMNGLNTGVYCDGPATLGSDNLGRVPPDRASATCAKKVVRALSKRATALTRCHMKAAKAALSARSFDVDACEQEAAAKFAATPLDGCLSCLSDGLFSLGLQLESTIDRDNGLAYCAGVTPFP